MSGVKKAFNLIFRNTPDSLVTDLSMARPTGSKKNSHPIKDRPVPPVFVTTVLTEQSAVLGGRIAAAYFEILLNFDALLAAIRRQHVEADPGHGYILEQP